MVILPIVMGRDAVDATVLTPYIVPATALLAVVKEVWFNNIGSSSDSISLWVVAGANRYCIVNNLGVEAGAETRFLELSTVLKVGDKLEVSSSIPTGNPIHFYISGIEYQVTP